MSQNEGFAVVSRSDQRMKKICWAICCYDSDSLLGRNEVTVFMLHTQTAICSETTRGIQPDILTNSLNQSINGFPL